jgi:uncharacterized protein YndB with AHSA1/START domain
MSRSRARSPFAVLVAFAVVLLAPARAGAQDVDRERVKAAVATALPGFDPVDDGRPGTGYLDASSLGDLAATGLGEEGDADDFQDVFEAAEVAGYASLFTAGDGTVVSITAFSFGSRDVPPRDLAEFRQGFLAGLDGSGATTMASPVLPDLVTVRRAHMTQGSTTLPAIAAVYFTDDLAIALVVIGEQGTLHLTDVLSAQTAVATPSVDVPAGPSLPTPKLDDTSTAYQLGQVLGGLMVLGGIVLVVVWVVRKANGREKQPWAPTTAGFMPPPPTGPAVADAPPPPPGLAAAVAALDEPELDEPEVEAVAPPEAPRRRVLQAAPNASQTITVTRTLPVTVEDLFDAIADPDHRQRWMPDDDDLEEADVDPPHRIRFAWADGGRVTITVIGKPSGRAAITIRHVRLHGATEAELAKAHWRSCLDDLSDHLAAALV